MKVLSSFTHPHVIPNLNAFLSSVAQKSVAYFFECECGPMLFWNNEGLKSVETFFTQSSFVFCIIRKFILV